MKWYNSFSDRLSAWAHLRSNLSTDTERALSDINQWWLRTPWTAYYLHWDDRAEWPDPWQLLSDNVYCDLARGLGILYTLAMIDRPDITDAVLAETDQTNLVLVNNEKYILNYFTDTIVNNTFEIATTRRRITLQEIYKKIK